MTRKNPNNNPLRIVPIDQNKRTTNIRRNTDEYMLVLSNLAIAESNLVKAGKDSAFPHFIAIVKEIEDYYGIKFTQEIQDQEEA